jgi:hypothetical protein
MNRLGHMVEAVSQTGWSLAEHARPAKTHTVVSSAVRFREACDSVFDGRFWPEAEMPASLHAIMELMKVDIWQSRANHLRPKGNGS